MAFNVGLVHAVETVCVEESVHLGLAGIVGCANGVDVGLLHQRNVLHHGLQVDGAAIERMRVLGVDTLEEHTLAVDKHLPLVVIVDNLHLAEAILGREHHFLGCAVELAHHNRVEVRVLGAPRSEAVEVAECNRAGGVAAAAIGDGLCALRGSGGVEELHLDVLLHAALCAVVDGQVDGHAATGVIAVEA